MPERALRLSHANELLRVIASCGRRLFHYEGRVGQLEQDVRKRLWFRDHYTAKRVYTAYRGRWRHFSGGGTNQKLVMALCRHVRTGERVHRAHFGPWPGWVCGGDLWGYGEDMGKVREAAVRLGIVATSGEAA